MDSKSRKMEMLVMYASGWSVCIFFRLSVREKGYCPLIACYYFYIFFCGFQDSARKMNAIFALTEVILHPDLTPLYELPATISVGIIFVFKYALYSQSYLKKS